MLSGYPSVPFTAPVVAAEVQAGLHGRLRRRRLRLRESCAARHGNVHVARGRGGVALHGGRVQLGCVKGRMEGGKKSECERGRGKERGEGGRKGYWHMHSRRERISCLDLTCRRTPLIVVVARVNRIQARHPKGRMHYE